jgi:hypothetical protein
VQILSKKQLEDAAKCCKNEMDTENGGCLCRLQEVCGGVPAICAEKVAQTALAYRAMLERLEWVRGSQRVTGALYKFCPICGEAESHGHKPHCELAALLKEG